MDIRSCLPAPILGAIDAQGAPIRGGAEDAPARPRLLNKPPLAPSELERDVIFKSSYPPLATF